MDEVEADLSQIVTQEASRCRVIDGSNRLPAIGSRVGDGMDDRVPTVHSRSTNGRGPIDLVISACLPRGVLKGVYRLPQGFGERLVGGEPVESVDCVSNARVEPSGSPRDTSELYQELWIARHRVDIRVWWQRHGRSMAGGRRSGAACTLPRETGQLLNHTDAVTTRRISNVPSLCICCAKMKTPP